MADAGLTRRELLAIAAGAAATVACGDAPESTPVLREEAAMHYRSLADVARLIAAKDISSATLTRQMLDRVAAVDGQLQSYVTVMTDRAIASAERADAEIRAGRYRGPLHGVPIAVKDLCNPRVKE